jgi:hypothetical protein
MLMHPTKKIASCRPIYRTNGWPLPIATILWQKRNELSQCGSDVQMPAQQRDARDIRGGGQYLHGDHPLYVYVSVAPRAS